MSLNTKSLHVLKLTSDVLGYITDQMNFVNVFPSFTSIIIIGKLVWMSKHILVYKSFRKIFNILILNTLDQIFLIILSKSTNHTVNYICLLVHSRRIVKLFGNCLLLYLNKENVSLIS